MLQCPSRWVVKPGKRVVNRWPGYICVMAVVGDLIRRPDGTAAVCAPTHCPRGHLLGPGKVLVGHQPCNCRQRGGHVTWECLECCAVVYAPPFMADCQPLGGAAAVR
jgi:hypothetical protein